VIDTHRSVGRPHYTIVTIITFMTAAAAASQRAATKPSQD
jgi:hypothetical protein